MTAPNKVGSAYVVLRAVTEQLRQDIRDAITDAFDEVEPLALLAGAKAGRRYAEGFKTGLKGGGIDTALDNAFNDLGNKASNSGRDAGTQYGRQYREQLNSEVRSAIRETEAVEQAAEQRRSSRARNLPQTPLRASSSSGWDESKVTRDSGGRFTGSRSSDDANKTKAAADAARQSISALSSAGGALGGVLGMLQAIGIAAAAALAPLAAVAVSGQLIGVVGVLSQISGALALIPAVAAAAGAGIATVKIATSGVADAFKAYSAQQKDAANSAYQYQQQVKSMQDAVKQANQGVASAIHNVSEAQYNQTQAVQRAKDAQESLTQAYKDARYSLEDLNLQLKGSALTEEEANLAIIRAKQNLDKVMSTPGSTDLQRKEADLNYRQSLQHLDEVKEHNKQLQDQVQTANQKGIEGSQQVVSAQRAVESANKGVADSQYNVQQSQQALTNAIENAAKAQEQLNHTLQQGDPAMKAVNEAMAKLSPNARDFVTQVRGLSNAWKDVKTTIQDNFFAGLGQSIVTLANVQLPVLKTGLGGIATQMNSIIKDIAGMFSTPQAAQQMGQILNNIGIAFANMRPGILQLTQMFTTLVSYGSAFLPQLATGFSNVAESVNKFVQNAAQTGSLNRFIQTAIDTLKLLFGILGNIAGILKSVFGAGVQYGTQLLTTFKDLTGRANEFLKSAEGKQDLANFFKTVADAATALRGPLTAIVDGIKILGPELLTLAERAAPGVTALFNGLTGGLRALQPVAGTLGDDLGGILALAGKLLEQFGRIAAVIIDVLTPVLKPLEDGIAQIAAKIGDMVVAAGPDLKKIFTDLGGIIPPLVDTIKAFLDAIKPYVQALIHLGAEVLPPVVSVLKDLLGIAKPLAPEIVALGAAFVGWKLATSGLSTLVALPGQIGSALGGAADSARGFAAAVQGIGTGPSMAEKFSGWIAPAKKGMVDLGEAIKDAAGSIVDLGQKAGSAFIDKTAGAAKTAGGAIADAGRAAGDFATKLGSAALDGAKSALTGLGGMFSSLGSSIKTATVEAIAFGRAQMASTINGAKSAVLGLIGTIRTWTITQTIASAATKAWAAVQAAFNIVMDANPIALIVLAIGALIAAVVLAYQHSDRFRAIVQAAWKGIQTAVEFAWNNVLKPALEWLWHFIQDTLVPVILWWWHNVIEPAFQVIGAVIQWWWDNIAKPVFGFVVDIIKFVASIFMWWWHEVIEPVFDGIGKVISWEWDNIIKPAWDAMVDAIHFIADTINWLYVNIVKPIWDALGKAISWVVDNVVKPALDGFKSALQGLHDFFDNMVKGIETIWNKIIDITRKPVSFVVNTIYNDGIAKAWNAIAGFIGLDNLKLPHIDGFATGGFVTGPGGPKDDRILARLSNGEYVLPAEAVSRVGKENLDRFVKGDPGLASLPKTKSGATPAEGMFIPAFAAGGSVEDAINRAKSFMQGESGKPYQYGGVGDPSWDCSGLWSGIVHVLRGEAANGPRLFNTESDFDDMGWKPGLSGAITVGIMRGGGGENSHMAGTIDGVNAESSGDYGVQFGGVARGSNDPLFGINYTLPDFGGSFKPGQRDQSLLGKIGSAIGNAIGGATHWVRDKVADLFEKPIRAIGNSIPDFGPSALGQTPRKWYDLVSQKTIDFVRGKADEKDKASGSSYRPGSIAPGTGPVQDQVRTIFANYGWDKGAEWDAAVNLINGESSWNPTARNPSSGAFGLFQFLGSTKDAYLPDENANPTVQADAGARYIRDRYGDPIKAWNFWQSNDPHWYDTGGVIKPGMTQVFNGLNKPEALLNPQQWQSVMQAIALAVGIAKIPTVNSPQGILNTPAPPIGKPSGGPQDDNSLNPQDQNTINNAPVEIPHSSLGEAEQNTGINAGTTVSDQFTGWAKSAGSEILGEFLQPIGLEKWSDKIVDSAYQGIQQGGKVVDYANQATQMGVDPYKIADTIIFNGMDPQKAMEELRRELSSGQYTSRFRG